MKINKKILVLLFFVIILITITIIVIISSNNIEEEEKPINTNPTIVEIDKNIIELKDNTIFSIKKTIEDFYQNIAYENYDEIFKILDSSFVKANNVTKDNIANIFGKYLTLYYVPEKIYYNNDSHIKYYFINGFLIDQGLDNDFTYKQNLNYLLIVKNSGIILKPLDSKIDILEYANNYDIKDMDINNNVSLSNNRLSEKSKLSFYLANFDILLSVDKEKAYNMISDGFKEQYESYENFKDVVLDFPLEIDSISKSTQDGKIVYKIRDSLQNYVEIIEEYPMHYKINF